jgi:uncharacterized membrane protein YhhN
MGMEQKGMATRAVFIAALIAGSSYLIAVASGLEGALAIVWKGAGVALLAVWAAMQAKSRDGWLIAAVMALGCAGDVLLEALGLMPGALAFAAGHLAAIALYLRNRRARLENSQKALALLLPPLVAWASWAMTGDVGVAFYAALLGLMASLAWTSRFSRYRTGIGAMLFVASDLLIFARFGGRIDGVLVGPAIWALYFAGQALIVHGVVRVLSGGGRAG